MCKKTVEITLPYGVIVSKTIVDANTPRVVQLNKNYSENILQGFALSNPQYNSILNCLITKNELTRSDIAYYFETKSLHESALCTLLWGQLNIANLNRFFNEPIEDTGNDIRGIESKLSDVKRMLNENNIGGAFTSMLRGHKNHIAGIGISFLTKILYFLSFKSAKGDKKLPLIYDKWTQSIHATLLLSEGKNWIQLIKSETGKYIAPFLIMDSGVCYLDYIELTPAGERPRRPSAIQA